jgi:hypothetical protein
MFMATSVAELLSFSIKLIMFGTQTLDLLQMTTTISNGDLQTIYAT